MPAISETTTLTLSLVLALLAGGGGFMFHLQRLVSKRELEKVVDMIENRFERFENKLDTVILRYSK